MTDRLQLADGTYIDVMPPLTDDELDTLLRLLGQFQYSEDFPEDLWREFGKAITGARSVTSRALSRRLDAQLAQVRDIPGVLGIRFTGDGIVVTIDSEVVRPAVPTRIMARPITVVVADAT